MHHLLAGLDSNKDQSYFLCQISQEQLAKALFPIGHLQKSEVRQLAAKYDLITAEKKDSQGLCFIGKVKLPEFLQQQLKTIQEELGTNENGTDTNDLLDKAKKKQWTKESKEAFDREFIRLQRMNPMMPDYSTTINYLELLF